MANQQILNYILIALAALVMSGPLSACKQPQIPSDSDMIKGFQDNMREYNQVVDKMMAEGNRKFSVGMDRSVKYQGSDKPPVSDATRLACAQVMRRNFCQVARRDGGLAQFIFLQENTPEYFRSKSIIYDKDQFKAPIWSPHTTDTSNLRYVPINANWLLEYRYDKRRP